MIDNTENIFLLILILAILFILGITFYFNIIIPFLGERRYIKMEISRTTGKEHIFWKRQLTIFYLYCIPVFGPLIAKRINK